MCQKELAPQAKGDYCKKHRHLSPLRKEAVKKSRQKRKEALKQYGGK